MQKKLYWYFYALAANMLACGGIHLLMDWVQYSNTLNSAPFSLWIWMNLLGFGGGAAVFLVIGWILQKRQTRKDEKSCNL